MTLLNNASDIDSFFNPDEFGVIAIINRKTIAGLFHYGYLLVNDIETRKPVFTCAETQISHITHGTRLKIDKQTYKVLGVKPDGTGLTTLILELSHR